MQYVSVGMIIFSVTNAYPLSEMQSHIADITGLVFVRTKGLFLWCNLWAAAHNWTPGNQNLLIHRLLFLVINISSWLTSYSQSLFLFFLLLLLFLFPIVSVITASLENRHCCQLMWGKLTRYQMLWSLYWRTSKRIQKIKLPVKGFTVGHATNLKRRLTFL